MTDTERIVFLGGVAHRKEMDIPKGSNRWAVAVPAKFSLMTDGDDDYLPPRPDYYSRRRVVLHGGVFRAEFMVLDGCDKDAELMSYLTYGKRSKASDRLGLH